MNPFLRSLALLVGLPVLIALHLADARRRRAFRKLNRH